MKKKFKSWALKRFFKKEVELLVKSYTGLFDRNGVEIFCGDSFIINNVKWTVERGYFGDDHKIYIHNNLNSGREVVCDIDELNFINQNKVVTPIPFFIFDGGNIFEINTEWRY